jgi:hypothetical protein
MMKTINRPNFGFSHIAKGLCAFSITALLAVTATAQIASGTTGIDNTCNAASEMAACKNGTTQQSRETCMTEVRNANAAKRTGKVDNAGGQFKANAMMRCDVLQGEDKTACQARVAGYGNPQGSVAGGGVLTQVETVVVPKSPEVINIQPQTQSDTIILIPAK